MRIFCARGRNFCTWLHFLLLEWIPQEKLSENDTHHQPSGIESVSIHKNAHFWLAICVWGHNIFTRLHFLLLEWIPQEKLSENDNHQQPSGIESISMHKNAHFLRAKSAWGRNFCTRLHFWRLEWIPQEKLSENDTHKQPSGIESVSMHKNAHFWRAKCAWGRNIFTRLHFWLLEWIPQWWVQAVWHIHIHIHIQEKLSENDTHQQPFGIESVKLYILQKSEWKKPQNQFSQLNFGDKSKIFGMEVDNGHINAHWSELRSETLNKKVVNILRIFFRKKNRRKKTPSLLYLSIFDRISLFLAWT